MSKSLGREYASRNITVNGITPGYIETEMTEALPESSAKPWYKRPLWGAR